MAASPPFSSPIEYEPPTIMFATYAKYAAMSTYVRNLSVRDKRAAFQVMRNFSGVTHNSLLPAWGITCGEFAVWQILTETKEK